MKKNIIYTYAFEKNTNSNVVTQGHIIEVLKRYLTDVGYVRVYSATGNVVKKGIKICADILNLLNIFCKHKIFFYPTIPLYPSRRSKEKLAGVVYEAINVIDSFFRIKHTVIIMDMPIEQAEDLNIYKVCEEQRQAVKNIERKLLGKADYIIDIGNFTQLCPPLSGQIIKTGFCPCLLHSDNIIKKDTNGKVKIFYAGDLRREYEKQFIITLIDNIDFCELSAEFHICGSADGEFDRCCKQRQEIYYYGFVQNNECNRLARQCDFAIMIYPNEGYYNYVSAAKTITYVQNGLPVLAIDSVTIKENIERFKIGEAVSSRDFTDELVKWINNREYLNFVHNVSLLRSKIESGEIFECVKEINVK